MARWALQRYDLQTSMVSGAGPGITYPVEGAFVTHLMDEYGPGHITAFDRCYGVSLDDALTGWTPRS